MLKMARISFRIPNGKKWMIFHHFAPFNATLHHFVIIITYGYVFFNRENKIFTVIFIPQM